MFNKIWEIIKRSFRFFDQWEQRHPYRVPFVLALAIYIFALFFTLPKIFSEDDLSDFSELEFIDMDTISAPKRVEKKEISTEIGDNIEETETPERASGDSEDAVDLAFNENIPEPRLLSPLKKRYPSIGRELEIEAFVNVELLIDENGRVKKVTVLGIKLTKELLPDLNKDVKKGFAREAVAMFQEARFTPPTIGKPIKMEKPLKFQLEN